MHVQVESVAAGVVQMFAKTFLQMHTRSQMLRRWRSPTSNRTCVQTNGSSAHPAMLVLQRSSNRNLNSSARSSCCFRQQQRICFKDASVLPRKRQLWFLQRVLGLERRGQPCSVRLGPNAMYKVHRSCALVLASAPFMGNGGTCFICISAHKFQIFALRRRVQMQTTAFITASPRRVFVSSVDDQTTAWRTHRVHAEATKPFGWSLVG